MTIIKTNYCAECKSPGTEGGLFDPDILWEELERRIHSPGRWWLDAEIRCQRCAKRFERTAQYDNLPQLVIAFREAGNPGADVMTVNLTGNDSEFNFILIDSMHSNEEMHAQLKRSRGVLRSWEEKLACRKMAEEGWG